MTKSSMKTCILDFGHYLKYFDNTWKLGRCLEDLDIISTSRDLFRLSA